MHISTLERKQEEARQLPPYDKGLSTRNICIATFGIVCLSSIVFLAVGIAKLEISLNPVLPDYPFSEQVIFITRNKNLPWIVPFSFTVIVTVCTEVLGYIHSTTLRWALVREQRLHYNSNLRLFSTARTSWMNGRIANTFIIIGLVLCYGGASVVVLVDDQGTLDPRLSTQNGENAVVLNPIALILVGAGLMISAITIGAGWISVARSGWLKSWNPNPLNTVLACMHHQAILHQSGRSTMNSLQKAKPAGGLERLQNRQPSAQSTVRNLRLITILLTVVTTTLLVAGFTCLGVAFKFKSTRTADDLRRFPFQWNFFPSVDSRGHNTALLTIYSITYKNKLIYPLVALVWITAWQSISTLVLHTLELLVNLRRDEDSWRAAYKYSSKQPKAGAKLDDNFIKAALRNKSSTVLLCLKPLVQWLYGLAIFCIDGQSFGFNPLPMFALAGAIGLLSLLSFIAARYQPQGPQPSTYGHIQTLANLVDDWGNGCEGNLYWGDKGPYGEVCGQLPVRRVGTSGSREEIQKINLQAEYRA